MCTCSVGPRDPSSGPGPAMSRDTLVTGCAAGAEIGKHHEDSADSLVLRQGRNQDQGGERSGLPFLHAARCSPTSSLTDCLCLLLRPCSPALTLCTASSYTPFAPGAQGGVSQLRPGRQSISHRPVSLAGGLKQAFC